MVSFNFKEYVETEISWNDLLTELHKKTHVTNLYAGNCGTFAQGAGKFLQESGIPVKLIVVHNDEDLFSGEPDIFHIFMMSNNQWFDGVKLYNSSQDAINMLEKTIATDSSGGNWTDDSFDYHEWNTSKFDIMIRNNTNFNISSQQFYNVIKTIVGNKKLVISTELEQNLDWARRNKVEIVNGKFILYHGTRKSTANKIRKEGYFRNGTYFTPIYNDALDAQNGPMGTQDTGRGPMTVLKVKIDPLSLWCATTCKAIKPIPVEEVN